MPQLRSFSSFAGTPGIGAAYVGGAKVAQDAISDAARISVERQKLSQDSIQANMRAQAQAQELQQKALMQSQELAVQQAYQQSMIGLRERELGNEQQKLDMEASQAAQQFQAQESIRKEVEQAMSTKGADVPLAYRNSMMKHGLTAGSRSGAGGGFENAMLPPPVAIEVKDEKGNPTGHSVIQTGRNSFASLPQSKANPDSATRVPGMNGRVLQVGNWTFEAPAWADAKSLMKKRDALEKKIEGDGFIAHRMSVKKSKDPKAKLTDQDKLNIVQYESELARLAGFEGEIARLSSSLTNAPTASIPEGIRGGGGQTNSPIRIKSIRVKGQ